MKAIIRLIILVSVSITLTTIAANDSIRERIIGVWVWDNVIDQSSGEEIGLEALTFGLAKEVRLEFREDSTAIEYKNKLEGDGFSELEGKWRLEDNDETIAMNFKGKWIPSKIRKFQNDTLIVDYGKRISLRMIRKND